MAFLSDYIKDKKYDVRMIRRDLASNKISHADVDKNEKKLADETDQGQNVSFADLLRDNSKNN